LRRALALDEPERAVGTTKDTIREAGVPKRASLSPFVWFVWFVYFVV
jgi:hypothetical protein